LPFTEQEVLGDSLSKYAECFIAHDTFGIVPVKSIKLKGAEFVFKEFVTSQYLSQQVERIIKGSRKMVTLCEDAYTEEDWLESA